MTCLCLNLLNFVEFSGPEWGLSWWVFHVLLKRMCCLLLLNGVFYQYQFEKCFEFLFQYFVILRGFFLVILSITEHMRNFRGKKKMRDFECIAVAIIKNEHTEKKDQIGWRKCMR